MRHALASLSLLLLPLASACRSTGCCGTDCDPQTVVEQVQRGNSAVTRLTVHCAQEAGGAIACASTSADKKGKPSDPEDLRAMQTGETVVLDEAGAIDVTVPILAKDGGFAAACGVTFKADGMSREQAVAKARDVAKAVEAKLGGCCETCGAK